MGQDVTTLTFSREDRRRYRRKVRRNLDVLARMLVESRFDHEDPMTGMEVELNLTDADGKPALRNAETLEAIAREEFVTELGRFNIEINIAPRRLRDRGLTTFEADVRASLNAAERSAADIGTHLVMVGILPTLTADYTGLHAISANPRYSVMNEQIFAARQEDLHLTIDGPEPLEVLAETILPEAACTSTQYHLQVSPQDFPRYWNAAQAIAGVQVALGANSPYFFRRQLWHETRIPVFEQSADTRSEELKAQGVRPRVWFGERWINSIFDLFEENVRYFPALLPICDDEDPEAVLEAGGIPNLGELRLHNGTVWRWNRPVYDISGGAPHVRLENRTMPAGPTVVDVMANGAFFAGLTTALADCVPPPWSRLSFKAAEENFYLGARHGILARQWWPTLGEVPATELVLRALLPLAQQGLERMGAHGDEIDRLLGVIEGRAKTGRNGATWQISRTRALQAKGMTRGVALQTMLKEYTALMHTNEPVHTWPVDVAG